MYRTLRDRIGAILGSTVFLDLTEFFNNPVRAGVQRCGFELLRRWPGRRVLPMFLRPDGTVAIADPMLTRSVAAYFADDRPLQRQYRRTYNLPPARPTQAETVAAMRFELDRYREFPLAVFAEAEFIEMCGAVFNPELFFDPKRIDFYDRLIERAPDKVFFLAYDFLLFLNPEVDPEVDFEIAPQRMRYAYLLRKLHNLSFISDLTKREFVERIARSQDAAQPVFPLGADGLGPRQAPAPLPPGPPHFVVLGAIEGRKRTMAVLRALRRLIADGADLRATFIGKIVRLAAEEEAEFRAAVADEQRLDWTDNISDRELAELIGGARATIFASPQEGYGLPPLESLSLGVPVIVSAGLPSFEGLPERGYLCCTPDPAGLGTAIGRFLDDDFAAAKRREIAELTLPAWQEVAAAVAAWVGGGLAMAEAADPDRAAAADLADLRRRYQLLRRFDELGRLPAPEAIDGFYRSCLGRPPTGGEFKHWHDLGQQHGAASRSLLLGLLAMHRDEVATAIDIDRDGLADLVGCALDGSGRHVEWLELPLPLSLAAELRNRLWRVVRAVELDGRGLVEIARHSLFSDGLAGTVLARWKAAAERDTIGRTFAEILRHADWPPLRREPVLAERYCRWLSLLAGIAQLPDLEPAALLEECYRTILGRPPDEAGLAAHTAQLARDGDKWREVSEFLLSREFRNRPLEHDLRFLMVALAAAGRRRRPRVAALLRRLRAVVHLDDDLFRCGLDWIVGGSWPTGGAPPVAAVSPLSAAARLAEVEDALARSSLLRDELGPDSLAKLRSWGGVLVRLELGARDRDPRIVAAGLAGLGGPAVAGDIADWDGIRRVVEALLRDDTLEEPGLALNVIEASRLPAAETAGVFAVCAGLVDVLHLTDEAAAEACADRLGRPRPADAAAGRRLPETILDLCVEAQLLPPGDAAELRDTVGRWVEVGTLARRPERGVAIVELLAGEDAAADPPDPAPAARDPLEAVAEALAGRDLWRRANDLHAVALAARLVAFHRQQG